ncbi:MAG: NAD(P)/FAD-dependent oxidoreductase [Bacteroidetes bacterium]|nr:NAD(P)/FAD-dependent oxidoreductase [Bacteroidota bacterium]
MHLVILGNGIAGITCARHIRKRSDHRITVISGETDHFFSRTALMYIYMGHMKYKHTKPYEDQFWAKNRIDLVRAWISRVDPAAGKVVASDGREFAYDKLVIASGSVSNRFGWPGQDLPGVQGLYSYQDLELLEDNTRGAGAARAVIVGGGLIGIELAEMLLSRQIAVTVLVRESSYWNNVLAERESALVTRYIQSHGLDLRLETGLKEIQAGANGRAAAVVTDKGETIACQVVGLTAGVSPNIGFLEGSGLETKRGVLVSRAFETNLPNVYAIGDCAEFREPLPGRRPVEQVWYTGREHGVVLAQTLCGQRTEYAPGPWFNSAKFLDLEWHTYGDVPPTPQPDQASLYWENASGQQAVHLVYRVSDGRFLGINSLGIRYRHLVFDRFLRDGRNIDFVLENLAAANFDPEFFRAWEPDILATYNRQTGKNLRLKQRKGLRAVLNLIKPA